MEYELTKEITELVEKSGASDLITEFSKELTTFFELKQYGDGLQTIYIGIICVSPEFDFFFKVRTPQYYKRKTIIQDDRPYELNNTLIYDIKLNYDKVIKAHKNELIEILSEEVIKSLQAFKSVKIKSFDSERFVHDIAEHLKQYMH